MRIKLLGQGIHIKLKHILIPRQSKTSQLVLVAFFQNLSDFIKRFAGQLQIQNAVLEGFAGYFIQLVDVRRPGSLLAINLYGLVHVKGYIVESSAKTA